MVKVCTTSSITREIPQHKLMTTNHLKPKGGKILTRDSSNHQFRILLVRPPSSTIKTHDRIQAIHLGEIKIQTSRFHQWDYQMEDSPQLIKDIHHPNNLCRVHRLTKIHAPNNTLHHHRCRQISITHRVKPRPFQMHIHHLSKDNNLIHVLTNSSNSMATILMTALMMRQMMSMKAWSFPDRKEREKWLISPFNLPCSSNWSQLFLHHFC